MNCFKCKKPATVKLPHIPLFCDPCFLYTIEKRLRKEIRQHFLIKPHEKIAIIDNNSKESKIIPYFLKRILKDMPIELSIINKYHEGFDKVFIPWNADDEANNFLKKVFDKEQTPIKGLKFLKSVSEAELQHIARILNIPTTKKEQKYSSLINAFEKTYPGTVFSIVKSVETIERISKKEPTDLLTE